jgi:hypothetical protein
MIAGSHDVPWVAEFSHTDRKMLRVMTNAMPGEPGMCSDGDVIKADDLVSLIVHCKGQAHAATIDLKAYNCKGYSA